jgi:hypothetical protein
MKQFDKQNKSNFSGLDPDPELVVKIPDPAKRHGSNHLG